MKQSALLQLLLWLLLSAAAYLGLGYFTDRSDLKQVLLLFTIAFAGYAGLIQLRLPFKSILVLALGFRLILIFAWPALSDDYFRFIWDGRLLVAGQNPFLHLPASYLPTLHQIPGLTQPLYENLNSPQYFTVYPPVCQFIFASNAWISPGSNWGMVLSMRLVLLIAEIGNIIFLYKLTPQFQIKLRQVALYAFNPLVIIELTGNLHFEALLLLFLLGSLYLLVKERILLAGIFFGLSIGVKLLPLIFLPFLLAQLGTKKFFAFSCALALTLTLLFLPFLSAELFRNIGQSLDLYFQKFEFNASIYYIFRWVGYLVTGYNNIAWLGPLLSFFTFLALLGFAYKSRNSLQPALPVLFLLALSLYLFLATTVHPWYITTLVGLAVLTPIRYPVIWSGAAVLSYATYQTNAYHENLYLTFLEYSLVFSFLIYEIVSRRKVWQQVLKSR